MCRMKSLDNPSFWTTYYLDTSALNQVADDPEKQAIINYLQAPGSRVFVSAPNILEIAANESANRRIELLELINEICHDYRPLAYPSDLLTCSLSAYVNASTHVTITISRKHKGIWTAMKNPSEIGEAERLEAENWRVEQSRWYRQAHEGARPHIQDLLPKMNDEERKKLSNSARVLQHYYKSPESFEDSFESFFKRCGLPNVLKGKARKVLDDLEAWRFYFAAFAVSIYHRTIKQENYGHSKNFGSIDYQQAIYLAYCDVFITHDRPQLKLMKILNKIGRIDRKVLGFRQLKRAVTMKQIDKACREVLGNEGKSSLVTDIQNRLY